MSDDTNAGITDVDLVCREVVELVTDYIEGDLDEVTVRAMDAHMAECDDCVRYVEQLRLTIRLLGRVPVESLPEEAKAELMAAFNAVRRRR